MAADTACFTTMQSVQQLLLRNILHIDQQQAENIRVQEQPSGTANQSALMCDKSDVLSRSAFNQ